MDPIVDVAVPALVFLVMIVVGTDLSIKDFRRVARTPRLVLLASLGQVVVLPLLCAALVAMFRPPELLAAGLVLLAACPAGALANFYTYMAGANTALAVTLTAVSSLISVLTLPFVTRIGFASLLSRETRILVPVLPMMGQLVFLLVLPVGMGMLARVRWGEWVAAHGVRLRLVSIAAVGALAIYITVDQFEVFVRNLESVATVSLAFTALAMLSGLVVSVAAGGRRAEHFTLMIEFSTRSLAIATVVAMTLLDQPQFVVMATAFLAVQTVLAFLSVGIYRFISARRPAVPRPPEGSHRS